MFQLFKDSLEPKLITLWRLQGYSKSDFYADLVAGLVVAIVALPLAMAIAIASNLPPERGLFTAIVAGFIISAHGGSRYQIGGPTAAFVVTVSMVAMEHGYEGLVLATMMAGIILMIMSFVHAGELIKFIPYPVVIGFTSGIALLIAFSQVRDFFGLKVESVPPDFIHKFMLYISHLDDMNIYAVIVSLVSVGIILFFKRYIPKVPGPIVVVVFAGVAVWMFNLPIETIESRFGPIPSMLPSPTWPDISFEKLRQLMPDAITIAILAAIESLLSAVVADGMTGTHHKSNAELFGQGIANIASGFFGGLPATGAIARTATNIKAGARTPVAGIMHAFWLFVFMLFLTPLIIKIPLAALAAILIVVAWNMSEVKHIKEIMKAPRSDRIILIVTFILTILVDLNFAIQTGIALASILFIDSMMKTTKIRIFENEEDPDSIDRKTLPQDVEVYEIQGPLFFGIAEKLIDVLNLFEHPPIVFILRMRYVPYIDAAGLHALEILHERLTKQQTVLILSGVGPEVQSHIVKASLNRLIGNENIVDHISKALTRASQITDKTQTYNKGGV
ncbi:sulfate permease [Sulfurimonas aquatica]|uniref:Sulfate permease n=1 Tax=Sulfurimonas aquatica TaxID=2672570 RepID=A0A975B1W9_9BACT|nr:sulfate permease [Sulfurimonas aquatica]QSZ42603.1 sulfate permease [Sulfurimonas aquatica]